MIKEIRIKIKSKQYELSKGLMNKLFEELDMIDDEELNEEQVMESGDELEMTVDGFLSDEGDKVEITYEESELTGMEGASTKVYFEKSTPELLTMLRGGSVTTAMVFEAGRRHICIYETPIMPFELCIYTRKIKNELLSEGRLSLDYIVEFKGAQAERTVFELEIEEKAVHTTPLDEYDAV